MGHNDCDQRFEGATGIGTASGGGPIGLRELYPGVSPISFTSRACSRFLYDPELERWAVRGTSQLIAINRTQLPVSFMNHERTKKMNTSRLPTSAPWSAWREGHRTAGLTTIVSPRRRSNTYESQQKSCRPRPHGEGSRQVATRIMENPATEPDLTVLDAALAALRQTTGLRARVTMREPAAACEIEIEIDTDDQRYFLLAEVAPRVDRKEALGAAHTRLAGMDGDRGVLVTPYLTPTPAEECRRKLNQQFIDTAGPAGLRGSRRHARSPESRGRRDGAEAIP